jgi:hypothetical protein
VQILTYLLFQPAGGIKIRRMYPPHLPRQVKFFYFNAKAGMKRTPNNMESLFKVLREKKEHAYLIVDWTFESIGEPTALNTL